jgi:hypothetical protein
VAQKTREQYRLSGRLYLVGRDEGNGALQRARVETWASLSDNARIQVGC